MAIIYHNLLIFCKICGWLWVLGPFVLSLYYLSTKRCLGYNLDIAKSGPEWILYWLQSIGQLQIYKPRQLYLCFVS